MKKERNENEDGSGYRKKNRTLPPIEKCHVSCLISSVQARSISSHVYY
jgi:hypothetical protein